jgi:hypothetical protein
VVASERGEGAHCDQTLTLFDGVREMLDDLASQGYFFDRLQWSWKEDFLYMS